MLETTFAVLAAAQAGMTCYGVWLITGGGEMPEQTREFWRVIHDQDISGLVPDGKWFESVTDSPDREIAIERFDEKLRRLGKHRIKNVRIRHIRETIMSEELIGADDEASV